MTRRNESTQSPHWYKPRPAFHDFFDVHQIPRSNFRHAAVDTNDMMALLSPASEVIIEVLGFALLLRYCRSLARADRSGAVGSQMIVHAMTKRALASIVRQGARPEFAPLLGALSFLATITLAVPLEWLVVVGTLTNRRQWLRIAACAATGSSLASIGLYFAFHHLGWNLLAERYPELAGTRAWAQASDWISRYGPLALFGLMALPLPTPKLPMLAIAGLYRLPIQDVVTAIWSGKIIKYALYAYVVTRFPRTIRRMVPAT